MRDRALAKLLTAATLSLAAAGCVHESASQAGTGPGHTPTFLGYSSPAAQQTVCGNCHVLRQASWIKTGHAKAWADLQASGQATAACAKCHTTNGTSNVGADSGGFFGVAASAQKYFHDVQCEACHGPGAAHVTVPDETQPIPYLVSYDSTLHVGCGTCHSGAPHASFYEDWSHGAHRGLEAPAISTGGACLQCHEGKTVEQRFGGSQVYVEFADATAYPIGCATCHNPHGSDNTAELREPITARDTTNLCIRCHHRNAVPDTANTRGPHSPQGPTYLGTSGWRPAGFVWDSTNTTTHANDGGEPAAVRDLPPGHAGCERRGREARLALHRPRLLRRPVRGHRGRGLDRLLRHHAAQLRGVHGQRLPRHRRRGAHESRGARRRSWRT